MIKTFGQYVKLREDLDGSIGNTDNQSAEPTGTAGDLGAAFKDLTSSLANGLTGPSGPKVLNAMVNSVMGDPQVPDRVKQEIRQKVAQRWSHVVDLNDSPDGQGPGLGNISGNTTRKAPYDPSMSNVVIANPSDSLGAAT